MDEGEEIMYFSNGSEGDYYQEKNCFLCKHWKQRHGEGAEGCPIWDAHLLYNYSKQVETRSILDMLITEEGKCRFAESKEKEK